MKPNNEDLESTLPEDPLPEPDDLLDALVDAESETSPRRRTSKTLIAALVLSGLGIWQIVHVSNGGEPIFQLAPKAKVAPTKLRSDGRAPLGRVLPSTDPIAAYLERAKRGMTDQEIRWMIEDFQTSGLDEEERWLTGALRAKQQAWYLEALTEALQLSPAQRAQAKAKMDELHTADVEMIDREVAKYPASVENPDIRSAIESVSSGLSASWLWGNGYAPWNLCDLTREQDQLTLHRWRDNQRQTSLEIDSVLTDPLPSGWLQLARAKQDPVNGNLIEVDASDDPFAATFIPKNPIRSLVQNWFDLVDVFPLSPNQDFPKSFGSSLQQARTLHPSQLRMLMLLEPAAAGEILRQIDNPEIQTQAAEDPGVIIEKPGKIAPNTITPTNELPPNPVEPETPIDPFVEPDPK